MYDAYHNSTTKLLLLNVLSSHTKHHLFFDQTKILSKTQQYSTKFIKELIKIEKHINIINCKGDYTLTQT
jgi:hypothetical protein